MIAKDTSSDVRSREPFWSRFAGAASRRLLSLDNASLCAAARRRTALEDFGDPPIEPALSVLLKSLEEEANLHPLGRFLMRFHLRDLLETRLRLADGWKRHAAALDASRIKRPIFIIGMPRTGSTFLHELLAEDPAHRAPRVWEIMFPVGHSNLGNKDRAQRIRKAAACLWWFRQLAPQADAVYPMRACTPHECVAIHSYTFLSEEFVSTCRVPGYETFLHAADLAPAYAWQRRFLQHLQAESPARRWVLKAPDHVRGLNALFSVFPDAVIIQTHRNPLEVVKSSSQLTKVLQDLYAWPGDREEIARREARVLAERMEIFIRFREQHPELADRFIDVNYLDLVSDPLTSVRQIYQRFDIPPSPAAIDRMRALASDRARYSGRRAQPTMADLGLDPATEARRFERYCSRFGVPCH